MNIRVGPHAVSGPAASGKTTVHLWLPASVKGYPTPAPTNLGLSACDAVTGRCWITTKGGNRSRGPRRSVVYGDLIIDPNILDAGAELKER
jgi:hypothetical protein